MQRSALLALHQAAGARLTTDSERPEVLTFGDVPAEYAAAQEGCALFDETDRGQVLVTGGERQAFLHRITANEVRDLEPGEGSRNLLLTSKGKVAHDFDLTVEEEQVCLSTPPGDAAALLAALDMYLFTEDVILAEGTDEHAPLALCGPRAEEVLAAAAGEVPELPLGHTARLEVGGGLRVTRAVVYGSPGWRLEAAPGDIAGLWRELIAAGASPAGLVVRDSLRVEAGHALYGADVSEDVYPQEARLERAFSLEKGCYIGQEVVAKIDTYGGLNKLLCALRLSHDDPVPSGTALFREQDGELRRLGVVTSWAYSFVLDGGAVLAYVKRRHQDEGTSFRLGEDGAAGEATLVALPLRGGAMPRADETA